jgi:hypothetical protein
MRSVFLLSVMFIKFYADCHSAECRGAYIKYLHVRPNNKLERRGATVAIRVGAYPGGAHDRICTLMQAATTIFIGLYYKKFYGRNLRIFEISYSV